MHQNYHNLITGKQKGLTASLARTTLAAVSRGYGLAVGLRGWMFDHRIKEVVQLEVPVISIGNLTMGGTGKTPTVIMLVQQLEALGLRPAVLTRGYKAPKGQDADEVKVIRAACPNVPIVVHADRVMGGRRAIDKHHANVLVMDDGFQHRRLHRDLNVVLVDSTAPFGVEALFPRGTWREPLASLWRADLVLLTRAEQVAQADLIALESRLAKFIEKERILRQKTTVRGVFDPAGNPVNAPNAHVIAFAGIGNPSNFLNTVRSLGMHVVGTCWFDDHHHYHADDFIPLESASQEHRAAAWVTTEKDQVKLAGIATAKPVWYVKIAAEMTEPSAELWNQMVASALNRGRNHPSEPTASPVRIPP